MTPSTSAQPQLKESSRQVFVFPCSFAQRRLWFLHQLDPSSSVYNITAPLQVSGVLDRVALQRSLDEVVRRHESLRTTFSCVQGEPMQIVACSQTVELECIELTASPDNERQTKTVRILETEAARPFDLERGPLLRAILIRQSEREQVLLLVMHHIITDGWSMSVLMHEVSTLYDCFHSNRPSSLRELPLQYADFSEWQRQWLSGEVLDEQVDYWKQQLAGVPPALELPTDWPRTMQAAARGSQHAVTFSTPMAHGLRHLARRQNTTLYMVLLAIFQALLSRYSGQEDISVGSPIAGRSRPQTESLIGFFVNTLVLRTNLSGMPSFLELLDRVKQVALGAFAHQDLPFEKLVEVLAPARDFGRTPFFQVMFILQNTPPVQFRLGNSRLGLLNIASRVTKFELTLSLQESGSEIAGAVDYRADLFESETIDRFWRHLQTLAAGLVADPARPLALLPLLTDEEQSQLFGEWNGHRRQVFPQKCVHQLFEEYAARMPGSIGVADENGNLTYEQLNARANQLARFLRDLHAGPEVSVGIFLEPCVEMTVGILAILKAGAGYVPLDPVFPQDRINYILSDSQVSVLLTCSAMKDRVSAPGVHVVCLDTIQDLLDTRDSSNLPNFATIENRVYTIYTSGSTGRPKGVVVEHRQIVNYQYGIWNRFGLRPGMHYLMLQPLAVDSSNTVLFPSICGGGTLHTMARAQGSDPYAVQSYCQRHRIDVLKIAPSHLAALLDACPSSDLLPVGVLALGGEGSHWDWMRAKVQPLAHQDSQLFIHYGPTETTVGVLTNPVLNDAPRRGPLVPLGQPLPNINAYVLDANMQPAPIGVPGEICIGGDSVARGYLNRPDLTAEKFVPDPLSGQSGVRLYRTGDLGRWLPEGELEFLGRTDYQVKIRGFRIELGEVESVLRQHEEIERAVAIAREDPSSGKQLVAYVTVKQEQRVQDESGNTRPKSGLPSRLRDFAREKLADYMVPAAIVVLEAMPLSPQGKIDLKALPDPSFERQDRQITTVKPRTLLEVQLLEVWEEVLQARPIGITDDFFQLGGHSLLAVRMIALMRNRFQRAIPLQNLFRNPTIAQLAASSETQHSPPEILVKFHEGAGVPFFCVHPIGGSVLCYAEFARALGQERPFYALQSPPANNLATLPDTLEEMASLYKREIQRVQAVGPYLLGGWSMGGVVAFEIAKQFQREGNSVGLLALFDTYPPFRNREDLNTNERLSPLAQFAADIGILMNRDVNVLREQFLNLSESEQKALLFEALKDGGLLAADSSENELQAMLDVFNRNSTASEQYLLQEISCPTVLFFATQTTQPDYLRQKWTNWVGERLACHPIGTNHYGIMTRPYVGEIAERLRQYFHEIEVPNTISIQSGEPG